MRPCACAHTPRARYKGRWHKEAIWQGHSAPATSEDARKRKTEIATGEENEGGVRTCPTSCTRTHHSCKNK